MTLINEDESIPRERIVLSFSLVKRYFSISLFAFGFNFLTTLEYVHFRPIIREIGIILEFKISILLSSALIALCFGALIGGVINDSIRTKFGQRMPSILIGTIITSSLLLIIPLFTELLNNTTLIFILLLIILIISHISLGFAYSPWLALLPDLFSKKERISAAIVITIISAAGAAIGNIVFSVLVDNNLSWVIWIITGSILAITGIITVLLIPKENPDVCMETKKRDILRIPHLILNHGGRNWLLLLTVSCFWAFGTHLIETSIVDSLTMRFTDYNETTASFASNILMGVYVAILILPLLWLGNKINKRNSSILASVFYSIFCVLLAIMKGFNWIYFIVIIGGIGNILISTLQIALPAEMVPKGREASFLGAFFVFGTIVKPLATLIQGLMLDVNIKNSSVSIIGGYPWVFILAAIIVISSIIFLLLIKEKRSEINSQNTNVCLKEKGKIELKG
ncbi:MAG: MFS transporter [Candidatus Heimdallarchaeota archaeon]|nr:MFS transporter [Candidatus Heimdallarchaeota archaeon]